MRRAKDWPGESPAPGDLRIVQLFLDTVDAETGADQLASPEALAAWLERQGLLPPGTALHEADLERARTDRAARRRRKGVKPRPWLQAKHPSLVGSSLPTGR